MKKFFLGSMFLISSILCYCSEPATSSTTEVKSSLFSSAIHLFNPRNLAKRLEEIFKGDQAIPQAVLAWLALPEAYQKLEAGIGRQLTQTAHDTQRKELYTGSALKPQSIVLTLSAKSTLEQTVQALQKGGVAHNIIIDTNGDIHPVTNPDESVEQALTHRPYALGIAGHMYDGCNVQRDMNSASITIAIVGKDGNPTTTEQDEALIRLLRYLCEKYEIRPDQILDYGLVAYPYGRRNPQPNLPWEKLTQNGIATYPIAQHVQNTVYNFPDATGDVLWASQALTKIGFIGVPATRNAEHPGLKAALVAFQRHTICDKQDGEITPETMGKLNSMVVQHEHFNPKLRDIEPPALPIRRSSPKATEKQS